MAQPQFGPPTLTNIAKGALAQKLDERLAAAAKQLASYVTLGGLDLTKKAKATVTLKIDLVHVEAGIFTVKGDVSDKAPSVPLPATDRLVLDDGQLLMPLSPEITKNDDPRQMTFAQSEGDPNPDINRKKEF